MPITKPALQERHDKAVIKSEQTLHVLPSAPEIEEILLGVCILNPAGFSKVRTVFETHFVFYLEKHQIIWQSMTRLHKQNKPIDIMMVSEQLKRQKKDTLDKYFNGEKGCVRYLMDLTDRVTGDQHIVSWAQELYGYYMRRLAIRTAQQILEKSRDLSKDIYKTFDWSYSELRKNDPMGVLEVENVNLSLITGSKQKPQLGMVGSLLRERDLAFLFSDEGNGKSIFSYQIAYHVCTGTDLFVGSEFFKNHCAPKSTILFDFELTRREIYDRYSREGSIFSFPENFYRATISDSFTEMDNMADKIINHIEAMIKERKPEFVIIDNLTWICEESSDNSIAVKIMKKLDALRKQQDNLSILVIAHAVKRDSTMPIESRHLLGASAIKNFCTNMMAISKSKKDPGFKYLKHLKCRGATKYLTEDNVAILQISKSDYLKMELEGFDHEKEHLSLPDMDLFESQVDDKIMELHQKGFSLSKIAEQLKWDFSKTISKATIHRKIKKMKSEKQ